MQLALAYGEPWQPPARQPSHWDTLLQEAAWMAVDFGQERLWKRYAARSIAFAAAAARRAKTLKPAATPLVVKCGDDLGKVRDGWYQAAFTSAGGQITCGPFRMRALAQHYGA